MAGKMTAKAAEKDIPSDKTYWVEKLRDDLKEEFGGDNSYKKPLDSITKLIKTVPEESSNYIGEIFHMTATSGPEEKKEEYLQNLEAVGKVAETIYKYKDDMKMVNTITTFLHDRYTGTGLVKLAAEKAKDLANVFGDNAKVIKKYSDMDDDAILTVAQAFAREKSRDVATKVLTKYEGVIKKYSGKTASSVIGTLMNAEIESSGLAMYAAKAIEKYEGEAAKSVLIRIDSALGNEPETAIDVIKSLDRHDDVIKKYKGEALQAVVNAIGAAGIERNAKYEENMVRIFTEHSDVVNRLEGEAAKYAAFALSSVTKHDIDSVGDVARAIGMYEGNDAKKVAEALQLSGTKANSYKHAAKALIEHADVVKKYEGAAQENVIVMLVHASINEKGVSDDVARAFAEHEGVIKKYSNVTAGHVAFEIGCAAYRNKETEDRVVKAFTEHESTINKHEGGTALDAAVVLGEAAMNDMKTDKIAAAIGRYEGTAAKNVITFLKNTAQSNLKMLPEVSETVSKLEDAKAFAEYQKEKIDISASPYKFRKSYTLVGRGTVVETPEAENKALYNEGMKIIEGIRNGSIKLDPDVDFLHSGVDAETAKAMKERLRESRGKDIEAMLFVDTYHKRKEELKNEDVREIRKSLQGTYTTERLQEELAQLSQHFLGGKPAKEAESIAKRLVPAAGSEFKTNKIELSVLPRSMDEIPTYQEYMCCAFPGYDENGKLLEYKINPAIELLKLKAGERTAMAITARTTTEDGKKVLLVDSFESGNHIFGDSDDPNKGVVSTAMKLIMEYAKAEGFDAVLVSKKVHNTSPQAFYNGVEGEKMTEPLKIKLDSNITDPYLETNRVVKSEFLAGKGKLLKVEK